MKISFVFQDVLKVYSEVHTVFLNFNLCYLIAIDVSEEPNRHHLDGPKTKQSSKRQYVRLAVTSLRNVRLLPTYYLYLQILGKLWIQRNAVD
jgi:hypothetical protein